MSEKIIDKILDCADTQHCYREQQRATLAGPSGKDAQVSKFKIHRNSKQSRKGPIIMEHVKPKYKVPSMSEINGLEWNGCNVASTFSGCGGSSLGYRMAGYRVLYANEFIEAARDSYNANKAPYTFLDGRDIREVTGADILEKIGLGVGELDLLDGSPPCASFSMAGNREKDWGKVKKYSDKSQRTDDLFFEFARILKEIQPKTFVAENVAGLAVGAAKDLLGSHQMDMFGAQDNTILHALMDCGYRVRAEIVNAKFIGVPQARRRLIFVGVRRDLEMDPVYPKNFPYQFTVRDAISDLTHSKQDALDCKLPPSYSREYDKIPVGGNSEKYFQLGRADWDKPVGTIHASVTSAGWCHPDEKRRFSIDEMKRLSGFPDDFKLVGNYRRKGERIGRSVPPLMMKAISDAVRKEIL
jgi:DNA (cytosine-5)-methyltransferase 1